MRIADVSHGDALFVAGCMREWDRREIFATRWNDSPADVAADSVACGRFGWIMGLDEPIAVVGAAPRHPGVWSVHCYATDRFPEIGLSVTRFVKRTMIPALRASGVHRAECRSIVGHDFAHRWLEMLGAVRESTLKGYGRGGEDFHLYVWSR